MKKTILAVVTTSLFAASANAAVVFDKDGQQVDVYGRVEYWAGQLDNTAGKADNFGGDSLARLGVNGKTATGYNDVALISKLEWDLSSENSTTEGDDAENNKITNRYAWLGADFANGIQATVGRVQNPFTELTDITDTYNTYSEGVEERFVDRWDDSAKVTYTADGWDLRAAVSFDDAEKANTTTADGVKAQNSYAVAEGYTIQIDEVSSLKPVIAYQAYNGTVDGDNYTNTQYALGLGYSYDAFYLGSSYGQAKYEYNSDYGVTPATDSVKETVWAVTTSYKILPALTLLAGFGQVDAHNAGPVTDKYYVLGTQYDITSNAKAYAEYKINDVVGEDDNYSVGLQYNF